MPMNPEKLSRIKNLAINTGSTVAELLLSSGAFVNQEAQDAPVGEALRIFMEYFHEALYQTLDESDY